MSRGCRSVCCCSAEAERVNWDTCLNGKTGRLTKQGTLKALCSVKQRGDMGKERRDKQLKWNASSSHCTHSLCLYGSQVISDQMRLIDFSGKFIVTRFYYKSALWATVICNTVCCTVLNHLNHQKMRKTLAGILLLCFVSSSVSTISHWVTLKRRIKKSLRSFQM